MGVKFGQFSNPFDLWMQMTQIMIESQAVIAMRIAGMMGLWPQSANEATRMVTEKQDAMQLSVRAALRAASRGAAADTVLSEALRPIGRRTRSNAKRLSMGFFPY